MKMRFAVLLTLALVASPSFGQHLGLQGHTTPCYLQFSLPTYTVSRDQPSATITVVRTGEFRESATVNFATQDGTAVAGEDYQPVSGALSIPAGVGFITFSVPLVRSDVSARSTTVQLVLSNPGPNATILQSTATLNLAPASAATTTAPVLKIQLTPQGQIALSWPNSTPAYVLEHTDVPAVHPWSSVTTAPDLSSGQCVVVEPTSALKYFYRLRTP